jgi:cation:H+ antiporter
MIWVSLLGGLALLLVGGDLLVRGAVAVAGRLGVSPMVIGLTLVGFGTSMPELMASLQAALAGSPGVAVGNVVGSNIANILLILGAAAVIAPLAVAKAGFKRDGIALIGATAVFVAVAATGQIGRGMGAVLVLLLLGYTIWAYRSGQVAADEDVAIPGLGLPAGLGLAALGIGGVIWGADLLVDGAITLAATAGVSEAVIGLTLVAIGTSLPELATSVTAALKRQGDLALGNIIGSNIFNILGIAGVTAIVTPLNIPDQIMTRDMWIMAAATVLMVGAAVTGWRISRAEGGVFLALYAAFLAIQFV